MYVRVACFAATVAFSNSQYFLSGVERSRGTLSLDDIVHDIHLCGPMNRDGMTEHTAVQAWQAAWQRITFKIVSRREFCRLHELDSEMRRITSESTWKWSLSACR